MATVRIQLRRGTSSQWDNANPTLAAGEIGIETDTNTFKFGDGVTAWNDLDYALSDTVDDYIPLSLKGAANGVAELDGQGYVPAAQLPPLAKVTVNAVADQSARLALTVEPGDIAIQADNGTTYVLQSSPASNNANWKEISATAAISAAVSAHEADTTNVHGIVDTSLLVTTTGTQTLTNKTLTSPVINTPTGIVKADVGLSNVDNTSDVNKPVSTAQEAADTAVANAAASALSSHESDTTNIHGIVDTAFLVTTTGTQTLTSKSLTSPSLTGTPTAPTAENGTDSTQIATTEFVQNAIEIVVGAAPAALNTLSEIATSLNNDADLAGTLTSSISTKVAKSGDTMSGALNMNTNKVTNLGTPTNNADAVTKLYVDNLYESANTLHTQHTSATTDIHGITNTANLVYTSDSRLSDQRTPLDNSVSTDKIQNNSISTVKIADLNVTTEKIDNLAVTTGKLADDSVTTAKILDSNVTSVKIADSAINSDKIAVDSVITAKILDGNVTTAKIADAAVTADKLASDSVTTAKITNSNVTTVKIADAAVTADKLSSDSVTTAKITDSNVTTVKIADAAVTADKLASNSVTTAKIADSNVTTSKVEDLAITTAKITDLNVTTVKIADAAVTSDKLSADSVTTDKIIDLNVTSAKIAANSVTTAKIADSNVTSDKIQNNAITTEKINDLSVTTGKIADSAITTGKIADGTIVNSDINNSAAIDWTKLAVSSTVSATELGYVADVTSAIQTQLDSKAPIDSPSFTGTVVLPSTTSVGTVSNVEIGYLDGVTSAIQTQIDTKAASTDVSAHTSATTSVHGISDTAQLAYKNAANQTFTGNLEVDGDMTVDGNLTVNGTTFNASATTITIEDNMVQLAHQNTTNTVDLGLVVAYNDGTAKHAGIVRDVSANKWKLFEGVTDEPSTTVNFAQGTLDDLEVADITASSATIGDVSNTELQYLNGVTSSVQTQLDAKAPLASPTFTGTVTVAASGVAFTDGTQTKAGVPSLTTIGSTIDAAYNLSTGGLSLRDQLIPISGAFAVTVPANSTTAYPVGTSISFYQSAGTGASFVEAAGVTILRTPGLKLRTTASSATLTKVATDTWLLAGDLSA